MSNTHHYSVTMQWTGNLGKGTSHYREYSRDHDIRIEGKTSIHCSSDPTFRGDPTKHNPEELFLASISSCHMLWFLHLASVDGVVVTSYVDKPLGTMVESGGKGGRFTEVTLRPKVTITKPEMAAKLEDLHKKANALCFIANSCNFPIHHESEWVVALNPDPVP